MAKRTIDQVDVKGLRVLMRVDFNVPLDGVRITDDRRVVQAMESIRSVIDRGGKLVLISHLGRPEGKVNPPFSLRPIAEHLSNLLKKSVNFATDCIGSVAEAAVAAMKPGDVVLLENLRFHAEEDLIDKAKKNPDKKPTPEQAGKIEKFASALAKLGDIYCNNAFGTCHRKHVSMYDVPMKLGAGNRVCGHLVQKELRFLGDAMVEPKRPFVAILGGAKVSDKIGVIKSLLPKVDSILIGGGMAYTFFAAQGISVGKSLCERDKLDLARELLASGGNKIRLPVDSVCATALKKNIATTVVAGNIAEDLAAFDIGPKTVKVYGDAVRGAKTIIWNGPMGVFETPPFDVGTVAIARALAEATEQGSISIIGGGDSAAAADVAGVADKITHISTGGGASLEFMEGKPFKTIEILDEA